jgi:hypothetical protein
MGTILASGLAKLGGQRSDSSHQPSASLASFVPQRNHPTARGASAGCMLLQARVEGVYMSWRHVDDPQPIEGARESSLDHVWREELVGRDW